MANAGKLDADAASHDNVQSDEIACANKDEQASAMPNASAAKPTRPRYVLKPTLTPVAPRASEAERARGPQSAYLRAENEDDDGYDPFSDRRAEPPLFEPDPWN